MVINITDVFDFTHKMKADNLSILLNSAIYKTINKGAIITGESGRCNGIPFVLSGTLRLFRISQSGREMTIYKIEAGEPCIMAAVCVLGDLKYDFSAQAQSKTIAAIISPEIFKKLMNKSDIFKTYIFNIFAGKLISTLNTIEMVNFVSIEQRVISYLQQNSDDNGEIITTHEKIAVDLGSSREVISRKLGKLASSGVIIQKRGHIKLIE